MNPTIRVLLAGAAIATFAINAAAYSIGAGPETKPGPRPIDCTNAKDRVRCESLNQDIEACRDKTDDAWRRCMRQPAPSARFVPPRLRNCAEARNKERCEAHNVALEACKDKGARTEHRKCMAGQLSAAAAK
jgi:hypothetical protein